MIGATTLGWMEFMCHYGVKNGENFDQSLGFHQILDQVSRRR
jgi:hypothetical protein